MIIFRSDRRQPGRSRWRSAAIVIVALAMAFVAIVVLRARSFDDTMPADLASVRNLPITFPNGRAGRLGDVIKVGRPTVINLWASWCGPCRSEGPRLAELRRQFGERLNLVSLNVRDEAATNEDREAFLKAVGLPERGYVILDTAQIHALTHASDNLVPRTLVFGPSGAPIGAITGYKPMALDRIAGLVE